MHTIEEADQETMGRYFDENYELLKRKLEQMAHRVQEMIERTIGALERNDPDAARQIIQDDEILDRNEIEIDELIMKLFALQQPMAVDLRFLITALKINNDLERMGDQSVNIAQGVLLLQEHPLHGQIVDFTPMEEAVQEMVRCSIDALLNRILPLANDVRRRDDAVDEMNRQNIDLLARHSRQHPEDAEHCVTLILVSHNLERIADLCTNIAEDVIYYVEGRIVKHLHEEENS